MPVPSEGCCMKGEVNQFTMLQKAEDDLRALTGMCDSKIFTYELFGFHAQQAIEKALKAWILHLGFEHPRIHDIRELLRVLESYGADITPFITLARFNIFAVQYRYDIFDSVEASPDRKIIIREVTELVEYVRSLTGSK